MPGKYIASLMNDCYHRFSARTFRENELCSLRRFDTSDWRPDYSNPLHREFYLLRYAPAYISEYYLIYKHIFDKDFLAKGEYVAALSLGCGAMLDLVGLECARRDSTAFVSAKAYYYGVDISDWGCELTKIIRNAYLFLDGIARFDHDDAECKYDIIMFPKSIADLDEAELMDFAEDIPRNALQKRFCVVNVPSSDISGGRQLAETFCRRICERLGYSIVEKEPISWWEPEGRNMYFSTLLENGYFYPKDILDALSAVSERCTTTECPDVRRERCKRILNKSPILMTWYAQPDIFYLEKQ